MFNSKFISLILLLALCNISCMSGMDDSGSNTLTSDLQSTLTPEVTQLISQGRLDEIDPLVGECACQVRGLELIVIYNKIQKSGIENLSSEDLEFLNLSLLLTKVKIFERNINGDLIKERTDCKKLPVKMPRQKAADTIRLAQRRLAHLLTKILQELAQGMNDPELSKALGYVVLDDEIQFKRERCATYPANVLPCQLL